MECEAKLEILEQVYSDVRKSFAELKLKHSECTDEIIKLKVANSNVNKLEQTVLEQTSSIKNLKSQVTDLQLSNAHNVGTVNLLDKQNTELQNKVALLELERASMQERIRVLETQQQEETVEKPRHGSAARRRARLDVDYHQLQTGRSAKVILLVDNCSAHNVDVESNVYGNLLRLKISD
ncbi:hypothetical protein FOCC_FOCC015864 [Frankliniella occidentalis]|nr:hypothetical protein FOCC_FOCC015864 [Frankliniella occidentalis]